MTVDEESFGHITDTKMVYDNVLFSILGDQAIAEVFRRNSWSVENYVHF
ncbi:hypothetical protein [Mucilaginibacter ginsenosidivorans]|nr:hypothetical protein [Mucilaginibacter ginsenosidivorans]